jgi:galactokinase
VARAAAQPGDLSEERVRQLYSQYVDTKRKQNESTASITYDNLAKSLRESSAKLKEKHAGKNVDFEVTVKDGKTILKPVVKEGGGAKK